MASPGEEGPVQSPGKRGDGAHPGAPTMGWEQNEFRIRGEGQYVVSK